MPRAPLALVLGGENVSVNANELQVTMAEVARRFGLEYASLRAATKMGLTPLRRSSGAGSLVATVAEIEAWSKTDDFARIERVKEDGQ